jgi:hypothetical protein
MAMDFGAPDYVPDEWQSAESLYTAAERQRSTSTQKDVRESIARYNSAADAFDALLGKTYSQYYDDMVKKLTEAREAAINAGAEYYIPEFLWDADDTADKAQSLYEAKDYAGAKSAADDAFDMYTALKIGLDAYSAREEIAKYGLDKYDPSNFDLGDEALENAASSYLSKYFYGALDNAESALTYYTEVMKNGWESFANEKRLSTSTERQNAINAKANVAVKQDFDAADSIFARANSALSGKRFDEAGRLFAQCEPMFAESARAALEKQQMAAEALRRANERLAASDEAARNADLVIEGGVQ